MKLRATVLALMSTGSLASAPVHAAADCNQLFVYAVQQFCSIAPNGQSLCQPIGLVGPAPTCALPGAAPTLTPMVLPSAALPGLPYNPYLANGRAANPYMANPGIAPQPFLPPQPFPLTAPPAPALPAAPVVSAPIPAPKPAPAVESKPTPAPKAEASPAAAPAPAPAVKVEAKPALAAPLQAVAEAPKPPASTPAPIAPVTKPMSPPVAAAARPVNPYLQHSGISVQPFIPWSPPPVATPAAAPATPAKPAPAPAATPAPAPVPAPMPPVAAAPGGQSSESAKPAPTPAPKVEAAAPAPSAPAVAKEAVVLFRFNSSRLTPEARKLLDGWLDSAPRGAKVYVTGHADRIGSARYNKKLSLRRAKSVRAYLVSKGMKAQSIQVAAKGYAAPVKACDGKVSRAIIVCLAPNRRVEVKP